MYGLPQAGLLAQQQLIRILEPHGYTPCRFTPGLWRHKTLPITFALVVDDFGIKYQGKHNALHLINILQQHYEQITVDWEGKTYCGITLDWDYTQNHVDISMPGYITQVLQKYKHPQTKSPQYSPHPCSTPQYGTKVQTPLPLDQTPLVSSQEVTRIQKIIGSLLFYARVVDSTLLVTLSSLAHQQAQATENTIKRVTQILDYCATLPSAKLRFTQSDMVLKLHSDA